MAKWLAIAGVALLAALLLLWKQLDDSPATAAPVVAKKPRVNEPSAPTTNTPIPTTTAKPVEEAPAAPEAPRKIDPLSDEFVFKFTDVVPKRQTANAARCYEGIAKRVHRNQSVVFKFITRVKNGVVTFHDVEVERSTLDNAALETCFKQEVARTTWTDHSLPDFEAEDQLTISPERGMKGFMRDNLDYVGEEAPR